MTSSSENNEKPPTVVADHPDPSPNPTAGSPAAAAQVGKEEEEEQAADGEEEGEEETLEWAQELFEKGSNAIEEGDFVEAVDCLSRALEIRVAHHGELAPECATAYYKYGSALLFKAQEETDPLGNVPKSTPSNAETVKQTTSTDGSGSSKASASNPEGVPCSDKDEAKEGGNSNGKDQEDGETGSDKDDEELAEGDEDESDLDLAWKMLDIARVIVEKNPDDSLDKVKIFSALAEVSMEREDIENSLNDYLKALSTLERIVEPDHRRIVELNFRICLVLELGSKIRDAIPYCARAISLCKSRIQSLKNTKGENAKGDSLAGKDDNVPASEGSSEKSEVENEIESLSGILTELEKKLEDLEQAMSSPGSAVSEFMKMITLRAVGEKNASNDMPRSASLTSSQMAAVSNGFDSPTMSSATTAGSAVTDLGIVGRGIKRANVKPVAAEPAPKKLVVDSSTENGDGSNSEVLGPTTQDGESISK